MPGVIRSSDLTNEEPDTQGKCDVLMPTNTSCLMNWHACFKTASYFPYFPHALRAKCLSISQSWFTFYSTPPAAAPPVTAAAASCSVCQSVPRKGVVITKQAVFLEHWGECLYRKWWEGSTEGGCFTRNHRYFESESEVVFGVQFLSQCFP